MADVKIDMDDVLKSFDPKTQAKFQRNILDRLTRLANKETIARVTGKYNLKKKDVKTKVTTTKQNIFAGYISASKRKLSLTKFHPLAVARGLAISVIKGATIFIEDAFIAQPHGKDYSSRGQASTATRKWGDVFMRKNKNPYPIDAKSPKDEHSISIGEYLGSDENLKAINDMMKRERGNITQSVVDSFKKKQLSKILQDRGE